MYISTKTGYALRALLELSLSGENEPLSINEVARRQQLPPKYLERLFSLLKKAELITSRKGTKGGYLLKRPTNEISLHDVMQAVDEAHYYSYCRHEKIDAEYCQGITCHLRSFWDDLGRDLEKYFSAIMLNEILNNYIKRKI